MSAVPVDFGVVHGVGPEHNLAEKQIYSTLFDP
jgi:hypothetical protein